MDDSIGSPVRNDRVIEPDANGVAPGRSWRRRLLRALVIYAVTPYVGVLVIFAVGQRWLLYPAKRTGALSGVSLSSSDVRVRDAVIPTAELHGWHLARTKPEDERLLVIYFPGNSGCRQDRIHDFRELADLGCDVLIFDYRGYGDNRGSPNEEALAADARRVWMFALHDLDVPPERIVLFGESLGGAVAVRLAGEMSIAGTPPAGLILNSTFASLPETVAWHYPAFPFQHLLLDRYPSADRIGHVTCPLLQLHGTDDVFVPLEHGRRLFDSAPERSSSGILKQFVVIEGGTHNAIPVGRMSDELGDFLLKTAGD